MHDQIVPMTIDDYDDAIALWQRTPGIGLHLDNADSREQIARYLRRNDGMSFVVRNDDRLIGVVMCGHDGRRGYLHHLAVDDACRQLGIGSALIARCLAALRDEGISHCNINVYVDNLSGRDFWARRGWWERSDLVVMQTACEP